MPCLGGLGACLPENFEISEPFSCNLRHTVGHFLRSDDTILIMQFQVLKHISGFSRDLSHMLIHVHVVYQDIGLYVTAALWCHDQCFQWQRMSFKHLPWGWTEAIFVFSSPQRCPPPSPPATVYMSLCRNRSRGAFSLLSSILFLLSVLTNLRSELSLSTEADATGMSCSRWRDVMTLGEVLMVLCCSFFQNFSSFYTP